MNLMVTRGPVRFFVVLVATLFSGSQAVQGALRKPANEESRPDWKQRAQLVGKKLSQAGDLLSKDSWGSTRSLAKQAIVKKLHFGNREQVEATDGFEYESQSTSGAAAVAKKEASTQKKKESQVRKAKVEEHSQYDAQTSHDVAKADFEARQRVLQEQGQSIAQIEEAQAQQSHEALAAQAIAKAESAAAAKLEAAAAAAAAAVASAAKLEAENKAAAEEKERQMAESAAAAAADQEAAREAARNVQRGAELMQEQGHMERAKSDATSAAEMEARQLAAVGAKMKSAATEVKRLGDLVKAKTDEDVRTMVTMVKFMAAAELKRQVDLTIKENLEEEAAKQAKKDGKHLLRELYSEGVATRPSRGDSEESGAPGEVDMSYVPRPKEEIEAAQNEEALEALDLPKPTLAPAKAEKESYHAFKRRGAAEKKRRQQAALEEERRQEAELRTNYKGPHRVAVCAVGHLRTFVLPGVYSGLAKNVIQSIHDVNGGGTADLFLIGHLGNFGHTCTRNSSDCNSPASENDSRLKTALATPGLNLKHMEIHQNGSCAELKETWKADGLVNRDCIENTNMLQIMWLDRCFRLVEKAETKYDLIVRTRPDVGVYQPLLWHRMSLDKISYMPHSHGRGNDWIFAMPTSFMSTWWANVTNSYFTGCKANHRTKACWFPDQRIWPDGNPNFKLGDGIQDFTQLFTSQMQGVMFPASIVRSGGTDPWAIVCEKEKLVTFNRAVYLQGCKQALAESYFDTFHPVELLSAP